jgi:hypothetical protein
MAIRSLQKVSTGRIVQPTKINLDKGELGPQVVHVLNGFMDNVTRKINGHLSFGTGAQSSWAGNFYAQYIEFTTPGVPDTQFAVDHGLGATPIGRIVVRQDAAGTLYDVNLGGWGDNSVYFMCDTASVLMKIILF